MISNKTIATLEFDKILSMLSGFAVSAKTKENIVGIVPCADSATIQRLQDLTEEAYSISYKYLINPIAQFDDISQILEKARVGSILDMSELLRVSRVLRSGRIAKNSIMGTGEDIVLLKELFSPLLLPSEMEKQITDAILSDNEMSDNASPELKSIRRKLFLANNKLREKLDAYTKESSISKYLQDNIVTVRNGRYVLPVKSECRGQIKGFIHDQSASGATVFIEPFAIVEMNNDLRALEIEQQREIEKILAQFTEQVRIDYETLKVCQEKIIDLDMIFAKSAFSVSYKGIKPQINDSGRISLIDSRHPLIDKNKIVPVTIKIGGDYKILIISGPNTGGKTVCLKTTGLFCLMAYVGLQLPCAYESEISVFDNIFCDIGDEQSIVQSLSTFSSHINNIAFITDNLSARSLVLLDEIGAGTDPIEGASLAVGILKFLELNNCTALITTHYSELKEYGFLSPKIRNACMVFDEKLFKPTYKIIIGMPGTSNALRIAKNLGLNDYILEKAYQNIKDEKLQFETVLQKAEEIKNKSLDELDALSRLREDVEKERKILADERKKVTEKLEKINFSAKLEIKKQVSSALERADEMILEIKKNLDVSNESALLSAKKLRKNLENMQYESDQGDNSGLYTKLDLGNLVVGQKVFVISLSAVGELRSLPGKKNEVLVKVGSIQLNVKISDLALPVLRPLVPKEKPKSKKVSVINLNPSKDYAVREIKVLGMTVGEAIEAIEPLIGAMYSEDEGKILKIIHGKGTGALRIGIQNYLKSSKFISSYRYGKYGEGETGVTFAEIK